MAGLRQIPDAELCQAMRSLPASILPVSIRTKLAMILDPPKHCPNRDYRFFAELLGLHPNVWEFLDAQKCSAETSSTRLIIKYLIDKRKESFKIIDIYEALRKMKLNGPEIILDYIRSNWRSLGLDTRPGKQNQETSLCTCRQCQQNIEHPASSPTSNSSFPWSQHPPLSRNSDSPPPSYENAVCPLLSMADRHSESAYVCSPGQLCGNLPVEHDHFGESTHQKMMFENQYPSDDTRCVQSGIADCDTCGCLQGGTRQTNGNILPLHGPKSLVSGDHVTPHQTRWEHLNNTSVDQSGFRAPPQDGHFNQLSFIPPSNGSACRDENPQNNSSCNIPPQSDSECFQNSTMENQVSSGAMSQKSSGTVSSKAGSDRPASFPSGSFPSHEMSQLHARPMSDGYFCSHQGACNCSSYHADNRGSQRCFPNIPSSSTYLQQCTNLAPSGRYDEYPSPQQTALHPSMSPPPQLNTRFNSNRSVDVYTEQPYPHPSVSPYPCHLPRGFSEATSVKQSMDIRPHSANSMDSYQQAGDTNHIKQYVFKITIPNRKKKKDHHRHFVLVLAGDTRLGNELSKQVRDLAQTLREYKILHVIVTSTSKQPIVWLTQAQCKTLPALQGDESSVSAFVDACYRRAKKILIAVSPGYVLYADEYVNGAKKSENTMQEIIRRQHEKMKDERANSSIHRLWPLLLHPLKTNRTHIPNFLTSVLFYWFGKRNVENFAVVLQSELQVDTHQNRI